MTDRSQRQPSENDPSSTDAQGLIIPARTARLRLRLDAPAETRVQVDLEAVGLDGRVIDRKTVTLGGANPAVHTGGLRAGWQNLVTAWQRVDAAALARVLLWLAFGVYVMMRLVALPNFPIYFFTDEAIQTISAADLLRNNLRSGAEFLPTYFPNGTQYNLSLSVYAQVLPYLLFGQSVWVTRGSAALLTLLAGWAAARITGDIFHKNTGWLAVLVLSLTPAWFLHSRTAFETTLSASLYAVFLYFYLVYRTRRPRALYAAVLFGALTFYAYSAMRVVMLVTAALLFLLDFPYHWRSWRIVARAAGLALLLALPFARFLFLHPDASAWQMRLLGSVWVGDGSLFEKLRATLAEYGRGLNPLYWYVPHTLDLARHTMKDYGHLLRQFFPFALAGLGMAIWNIRQPAYRALLVAVLAAPAGAALVRLGVTRALVMVIPMAILTTLALSALLDWLHKRWKIPRVLLALALFGILSAGNAAMLIDSLSNGPLWFRDYGLNGMQYGARQLFTEIKADLAADPQLRFVVSPSWANGTDVVARFFIDDPRLDLGSAEGYYAEGKPIEPGTVFVMIPEEFEALPRSRFAEVYVWKTMPYPDGRPGFYFVRLAYVDAIQDVIAEERADNQRPRFATVLIGAQPVELAHTRLDMGEPAQVLDGSLDTLIRTQAINPLLLDFHFPVARPAAALVLHIGGTATRVEVTAWKENADQPLRFTQSFDEAIAPRSVRVELVPGLRFDRLQVQVYNTNDPPEGHVHLWELSFEE